MIGEVYNLLKSDTAEKTVTLHGVTFEHEIEGWVHVHGTADAVTGCNIVPRWAKIQLEHGSTYTLSVQLDGDGGNGMFALYTTDGKNIGSAIGYLLYGQNSSLTFTFPDDESMPYLHVWGPRLVEGATVDFRVRLMLVEGATPAAWAPAEGEEIAGGGGVHER